MKKIFLMLGIMVLSIGAFAAPNNGRYMEPWPTNIVDFLPMDYSNNGFQPLTTTGAGLVSISQANGISLTAALIPASILATNVYNFNFRVPNNYKQNGKIFVVYQLGASDTSATLRADLSVQYPGSLTTTTVSQGTAVALSNTVQPAGTVLRTELINGISSNWAGLTGTAGYTPNAMVNCTVARVSGVASTVYIFDTQFEYQPLGLLGR